MPIGHIILNITIVTPVRWFHNFLEDKCKNWFRVLGTNKKEFPRFYKTKPQRGDRISNIFKIII